MEEFILVQDDDSHWYVIPNGKDKDWEAWIGTEDYEAGIVPGYAKKIGVSPRLVVFSNYRILN